MPAPLLDADLEDDLHDAFRLMYDGIDVTFALDAAYAEEDEEIPLDSVAPDMDAAVLEKQLSRRHATQQIPPRSRIRSVLDAALDLDEAHRRPAYGYKKARIQEAYRRVEALGGGAQGGPSRKRTAVWVAGAVLGASSAGRARTSTGTAPADAMPTASRQALDKLRALLDKRRGTPASSQPAPTPALTHHAHPYAPFSVEAYHARLLTFSARSWTTKHKLSAAGVRVAAAPDGAAPGDAEPDADPLRAAEAARHGWTSHFPTRGPAGDAVPGARADVLRCDACGVAWAVGCSAGDLALAGLKDEWLDKLVRKTAEQYVLAHAASCPWRRLQSPPTIYDKLLPSLHPLLSLRLAQIALDIEARCPALSAAEVEVRSPLSEQERANLVTNLQAALHEDVEVDSDALRAADHRTPRQPTPRILPAPAVLAFFGWTAHAPSAQDDPLSGSLECKLCGGGRILPTDLRGGPIDVLKRHSDHCPVVAAKSRDVSTQRRVPWWHGQALLRDATWASDRSAADRLQARVREGLDSL